MYFLCRNTCNYIVRHTASAFETSVIFSSWPLFPDLNIHKTFFILVIVLNIKNFLPSNLTNSLVWPPGSFVASSRWRQNRDFRCCCQPETESKKNNVSGVIDCHVVSDVLTRVSIWHSCSPSNHDTTSAPSSPNMFPSSWRRVTLSLPWNNTNHIFCGVHSAVVGCYSRGERWWAPACRVRSCIGFER